MRKQSAEKRILLKTMKDKVKKLEQSIQRNQKLLDGIEEKLADASIYNDENKETLNSLLKERGELVSQNQKFEEEWLKASESLE